MQINPFFFILFYEKIKKKLQEDVKLIECFE